MGITEKTSLKKELVEENKKIIYIFLILWPSLGWSSLALLHLVALGVKFLKFEKI